MRTALLVSLFVHGAAAVGLALVGVARVHVEPRRPMEVAVRADTVEEIERPPDDPPIADVPPAPEIWEIPEETPAFEEIETPREAEPEGARPMGAFRLREPLSRPRRASAAPVAAPPAPPSPVARTARNGELRPPRVRADLSPVPSYPARARRLGLEGSVVLLVSVGADGAVAKVSIASSSGHEELDRAAAEAVALWRFEPARRDGLAVAYDVRLPVEFRLTDA
jgi:protein TonB